VFIPFITDGVGARAIGAWFGTGPDRGIALVFVLTGIVGFFATVLALRSLPCQQLSRRHGESPPTASEPMPSEPSHTARLLERAKEQRYYTVPRPVADYDLY
jgi:MFS transporter, DHA3 family, multidrug efflux protein